MGLTIMGVDPFAETANGGAPSGLKIAILLKLSCVVRLGLKAFAEQYLGYAIEV